MQSMPPPQSMQPQGGKYPPDALPPRAMPPRLAEESMAAIPAPVQRAAPPPSQPIGRLVGPVLVMVGVCMLANQGAYQLMSARFLAGYPFIYFSGILALVAGLAILSRHPQWTRDWRSVITAVGWVLTCMGSFRTIAPQFANFIARRDRTPPSSPAPAYSCWRSAATLRSRVISSEDAQSISLGGERPWNARV